MKRTCSKCHQYKEIPAQSNYCDDCLKKLMEQYVKSKSPVGDKETHKKTESPNPQGSLAGEKTKMYD